MNKHVILIALIISAFLLAACNTPSVKTDNQPSDTSTTASEEAVSQTDSGLTLAAIKKAAESAGLEVEAAQEPQMDNEPKPVDGFTVIVKDENNEAHIPILEFKNSDDAQAYAKQVNEAGYNLCIVNGKFLTMTSAQYGVTVNDNETKTLEMLLKSKAMIYVEPTPAPLTTSTDYAGTYLYIDAIYTAIDKLINKSVLLYDKTMPEEERISTAFISFYPLSSGDLAFTATMSEDQVQLDAIVQVWEMFGATDVKLTHSTAHDYILTGKRAGVDTAFELRCSFDPKTGSLRLIDTDGGEVLELYEFVPLGGDTYAFQTLYSRAIVNYKDGKIMSFVYAQKTMDEALAYSAESDGIYGKTAGLDEAWVSSGGADSYEQFITYDGTTLKIAADSFMGDRLTVEIAAQY